MTSRNIVARIIAGCYLVLGIIAAFYIISLSIDAIRGKAPLILVLVLAPSAVIAIISIIIYRIFIRYSEGSLNSLSGLLGVSAFYISGILLKHPFDKITENRDSWHLLVGLSPILIGYVAYRLAKFYFFQDFKEE